MSYAKLPLENEEETLMLVYQKGWMGVTDQVRAYLESCFMCLDFTPFT